MQQINVLIAGNGSSVDLFKNSKFLNKLYVTSEEEIPGTLRIIFNTFQGLAEKCKALQVDIVIVENEKWILQGIANVMKRNHVTCFCPTSHWTNLELSQEFARNLLTKYDITVPPKINLPNEFPVLVKGDGVLKKANSLQDIISIKENIFNTSPNIAKNLYIEKYLNGEKHKITSIYDGKTVLTFPQTHFNEELVKEYSQKLQTMLVQEDADFIGFINSELIEEKGKLYNTGFSFEFTQQNTEKDIIYILLSAVYQKLNEL